MKRVTDRWTEDAAAGHPSRSRPATVLADRDAELALLEDAVRATVRGNGALLVISGAVGIGKTALLDAIANTAVRDGAEVLRATASVAERRFPLGVARQLCDSAVAGMSDEERATILNSPADPARPALPVDGACPDRTARHAAHHLLAVAGDRKPVVLLVDDLQWVDDESVRCLGHVAERLSAAPVLLVLTVRETMANGHPGMCELIGNAGRVLRPRPLSTSGVAAVVRAMFGEEGGESLVRACTAVSRGNPLVVRAVLGEVAAAGARPTDDLADLVLSCRPAMLRDRMAARLRGQPGPAIAYLRALGCLGPSVEPKLVGRLAELDVISSAEVARSLAEQGFLTSDLEPGFVHPVVREAVEKVTPTDELERLHITAATVLHSEGYQAEEVAGHLLAVPSRLEGWAIEVLRDAAVVAGERGSVDAAARYLRRALLDTEPGGVGRADLLLELAAVEGAVDPSASVRHVLEAVSLSEPGTPRATALVRLSPLSVGMAPASVTAVVREAATALGDGEDLTGAERELALRLEARIRAGDSASAHRIDKAVQRLRTLDRTRCLRTPAGRELLAVLLEIAAISGAVPSQEVAQLGHRLLELEPAGASGNTAVPMVVSALTIADQAAPAAAWLDAALGWAVRRGDVVATATIEIARALVLMGTGRIGAGADAALASTRAIGDRWFDLATVAGVFRMATVFELHVPEAGGRGGDRTPDLSERIVDMCGHRTDHPVVVALTRLTAARTVAGRDPRLALEHLQDSGRQLDRAGWRNPAVVPWRTCAAALHQQLGNQAVALSLAESEHELAVAWGSAAAVGRALRVRGALTPGEKGLRLLREAVAVLADSENQLERARTYLLLGIRLARSGAGDAEEWLRRGRVLAEIGAARAIAEREAQSFGGRPASPCGGLLTPAEWRVAAIAVGGRTNQEIADELGISRRAVEKHLTSAYLKLNVTGRAELRERLTG